MSGHDGNRVKPVIDGTEWVPLFPTDNSAFEQTLMSTIAAYMGALPISTAVALAAMTAVANALPTTLPSSSGVLWNNGGVLCLS